MIETYERSYAVTEFEIERGGDGRTVTAYAAVFDAPAEIRDVHGHYMEEIDRAAFNRTLDHIRRSGGFDRVGVFYNHGMDLTGRPNMLGAVPLGDAKHIEVDSRGLLTVTRYNHTPLAESTLCAIRDKSLRGQSFRGRIFRSSERPGQPLKTVVRHELGLKEYGPTPFPAYAEAGIMAVRSTEVAAALAALTDEERAELIRTLSESTQAASLADPATSTSEPGISATRTPRSGRTVLTRNRLLAEHLGLIEMPKEA